MEAKALVEFCQEIGIEPDRVKKAETPEEYHLSVDLPAWNLKRLSLIDLELFAGGIGDALSLSVGIPSAPMLEIRAGRATTDLDRSLRHIAKVDDSLELPFTLDLDKAKLLKKHQLFSDSFHALFYLFSANLAKFLQSSVLTLDDLLFTSRYQPTAIAVSDANPHYTGPFLTIAGVDGATQLPTTEAPIPSTLRSRVDKYHDSALNSFSWLGFQLKHVTPLHFVCQRMRGEPDDLDLILWEHTLRLSILYTANRSTYDGSRFQAVYTSPRGAPTLALGANVALPDRRALLLRLALWPHGGRETDRLAIFQNVVARTLEADDPEGNSHQFVGQLQHLLSEARWHHRVFLDDHIHEHTKQVQKVTSYVAQKAKEVSQACESVTKTFADALLATVGVVILTLLAALFKSEIPDAIFQIGLWACAAYLLLFHGCYRMGSIWHSYNLLRRETDERLTIYAEELGRRRTEALARPYTRRKRQFSVWVRITIAVYVVIIALIGLLGAVLPSYLAWTRG